MTQPHEPEPVIDEITVSPSIFDQMQHNARHYFGKEVGGLNFDEAADLIASLMHKAAQTRFAKGRVLENGRTIIDSIEDGNEAYSGFMHVYAKEMEPHIDDAREIILNITRDRSLWQRIRNHEPEVAQTIRFRNEPPQYA